MSGANLEGANLRFAKFQGIFADEAVVMPDGKKIDGVGVYSEIERFTNPEHPDFWRSDDPKSPAYQGKQDDEL